MYSLIGTLEADVEISASADNFFEVICNEPFQLTTIVPDIVKSCDLLDGLWGALGAIIRWSYVFPTLAITSINPLTKSITYGLIEGDLTGEFSTYAVKIDAAQNLGGSTVHLTITYVKLTEDIPTPQALLDLGVDVIKGLGAYLAQV